MKVYSDIKYASPYKVADYVDELIKRTHNQLCCLHAEDFTHNYHELFKLIQNRFPTLQMYHGDGGNYMVVKSPKSDIPLMEIKYEHYRGMYAVGSPRINGVAGKFHNYPTHSGNVVKTADPKKVLTIMSKLLNPITYEEMVYLYTRNKRYDMEQILRRAKPSDGDKAIARKLFVHIDGEDDQQRALLRMVREVIHGKTPTVPSDWQECIRVAQEETQMVDELARTVENKSMVLVMQLLDGDYYVGRALDHPNISFGRLSDLRALPESIQRGLMTMQMTLQHEPVGDNTKEVAYVGVRFCKNDGGRRSTNVMQEAVAVLAPDEDIHTTFTTILEGVQNGVS